jgi:ABC-type multidrug transport system ATPase subunit
MNDAAPTLEIRDLVVRRGTRRVLDGVSLSIRAGETVAVVGPNGAGKTTLLEAIVGALPIAAGDIQIQRQPLGGLANRARWLGHLSGEAEPALEARVGLVLDADERGEASWKATLETRLGLADLRRALVGSLSRGERRRVLLYEALAAPKAFLLLDEPTGVFDPLQLLDIVRLLQETAARGAGLLVTVHQMSDAEALASRILVLDGGRTVAFGTMVELRAQAGVPATTSLHDTFLALLEAKRSAGSAHEA